MGYRRALRYFRLRILRVAASPYAVAAGFSVGAAAAWTPLLGFHIIVAIVLAYVIRANVVAAALGTIVANPLTLPFMWAASWRLGSFILGREEMSAVRHIDFLQMIHNLEFSELWGPVLKPMLIGCAPLALGTGILFYVLIFFAVRGFQIKRRQAFLLGVERRLASHMAIAATDRGKAE